MVLTPPTTGADRTERVVITVGSPGRRHLIGGDRFTRRSVSADEPKERSDLVDEKLRLLPGAEVPARGKPVVPTKVGVARLEHAARRAEHLAGENRHAGGHVDTVLVEAPG